MARQPVSPKLLIDKRQGHVAGPAWVPDFHQEISATQSEALLGVRFAGRWARWSVGCPEVGQVQASRG